jgi:hypothetical protein
MNKPAVISAMTSNNNWHVFEIPTMCSTGDKRVQTLVDGRELLSIPTRSPAKMITVKLIPSVPAFPVVR